MKKNLLLLATLVFGACAFTACGDSDDDNGGNVWNGKESMFGEASHASASKKFEAVDGKLSADFTPGGRVALKYDPSEFSIPPKVRGMGYTIKESANTEYYVGPFEVVVFGESYKIPGLNVLVKIDGKGEVKNLFVLAMDGAELLAKQVKEEGKLSEDVTTKDVCRTWTVENTEFKYTEYTGADGKKKSLEVRKNFKGCNLEDMAKFLKDEYDVDIVEELAGRRSIDYVDLSDHGTFTIKMGNDEDCVGKWKWYDEAAGVLNFDWYSADMTNSFENGTAVVRPIKGVTMNLLELTLKGGLLELTNNPDGKYYTVELVALMSQMK